jgi:Caspase domain/WD domain, G-beta repeat
MPGPDLPPLRDYSRSRAVVMGTSNYAFLTPIPAVEYSMRRMGRLLTGPLCGWPPDRVLCFQNEAGPGEIPDRLITAFDGVSDIALFYFAGHGQIAPDDQLCLGLVQSRPEPNRRVATSLRFSDVRQVLQDSAAAIKIVILDCCFAGLATPGVLAGSSDVLDLTAGTGAYTMAATSAYATAWFEETPGLAEPQTYFTKYLADVVERGIPGQPFLLRLDPVFKQVRDNLAADRRPVPRSRAVNDAREFVFAYNAAPPDTHHDPERELAKLKGRLAEAGAQVEALRSVVIGHETELASLRSQLARTPSARTEKREELQLAIDTAARQLDNVRVAAAEAAASRSASFPVKAYDAPIRRILPKLAVRGVIAAVVLGGTIAGLIIGLPGGGHQSVGGNPTANSTKTAGRSTATAARATSTATRPASANAASVLPWMTLPVPAPPEAVAFGPGGSSLAAGTEKFSSGSNSQPEGGTTYLWDTATWTRTTLPDPATKGVEDVEFGPYDSFAAFDSNGSVYLWDTTSKELLSTVTGPSLSVINGMGFTADGTLITVGVDGTITLWDTTTSTGQALASFSDPRITIALSQAVASNGAVAIADSNGKVWLWNTTTENITGSLPGLPASKNNFYALAFAPNSQTLAAGNVSTGKIYLWDTASGKVIVLDDPKSKGIAGMAFAPNGASLAAADFNGNTYLWNLTSQKVIYTFTDPSSQGVYSVAFGPGGTTLATGDGNDHVYLWQIKTG